eukprot:10127739-Alexandrium_andersonii.AAC.1
MGRSRRPQSCGVTREAASAAPAAADPGIASQNLAASKSPAKELTACGGCTASREHRDECNQAASSQNVKSTRCLVEEAGGARAS